MLSQLGTFDCVLIKPESRKGWENVWKDISYWILAKASFHDWTWAKLLNLMQMLPSDTWVIERLNWQNLFDKSSIVYLLSPCNTSTKLSSKEIPFIITGDACTVTVNRFVQLQWQRNYPCVHVIQTWQPGDYYVCPWIHKQWAYPSPPLAHVSFIGSHLMPHWMNKYHFLKQGKWKRECR